MSDLLFSLLLNGYIKILAAVERRSIKRGDEGNISPLRTEDLPSSNWFLISRHPSIKVSLLEHLSLTQRLKSTYFFICFVQLIVGSLLRFQGRRWTAGPKPFSKLVKLRPSWSNPISWVKMHGKMIASVECMRWTRGAKERSLLGSPSLTSIL